jgi:hypothetical protein
MRAFICVKIDIEAERSEVGVLLTWVTVCSRVRLCSRRKHVDVYEYAEKHEREDHR